MQTTIELMDQAKAAAGIGSDYALAKLLGVSRAAVSQWRNGKGTMDDEAAAQVAALLQVEPGYVMACAQAERAKSEKARGRWARVAALLLAAGLPPAAGAANLTVDVDPLHIIRHAGRAIRRLQHGLSSFPLMLSL